MLVNNFLLLWAMVMFKFRLICIFTFNLTAERSNWFMNVSWHRSVIFHNYFKPKRPLPHTLTFFRTSCCRYDRTIIMGLHRPLCRLPRRLWGWTRGQRRWGRRFEARPRKTSSLQLLGWKEVQRGGDALCWDGTGEDQPHIAKLGRFIIGD